VEGVTTAHTLRSDGTLPQPESSWPRLARAAVAVLASLPPVLAQSQGRVGLVLSGGGARGAAHIGVLQVLEEMRVPVHVIAGTSMGSLVGGLYAYGYSPDELERIVTGLDWKLVLRDESRREDRSFRRKLDDGDPLIDATVGFRDFSVILPKGLIQGQRTGNILRTLAWTAHDLASFDELALPFRAVATDIGTGEEVVLSAGNLPLAMSASMAVPGVFAPVRIDGRDLSDGMLVNNIPISVARALGADEVITVDVGTPLLKPEDVGSLFAVTEQMLGILMKKNDDAQLALLGDNDVLIRPELGAFATSEFDRAAEAIAIGRKAALAAADRLRRFAVSEEEYRAFLARQRRTEQPLPRISAIELVNNSGLADEVLLALVSTHAGGRFDPEQLNHDIDRIWGLDEFERVTYELRPQPDGTAVVRLTVQQKSWGPGYLQFGLTLTDDLSGNGQYGFGILYTQRMVNRLGAEWRNYVRIGTETAIGSEFYQPLLANQALFVAPRIEYRRDQVILFEGGQPTSQLEVNYGTLAIDAGAHAGNWAELRAGLVRSIGDIDVDFTSSGFEGGTFDDAVFRAALLVDTLDDVHFPHTGTAFYVEWLDSLDWLGADDDYERLESTFLHAVSFDANTVVASANFGTVTGGTLPVYRLHRRGGFLDLSGLVEGQLTGQYALVGKLVGYRRLGGKPIQSLGMPVYAGGSIEAGGVWEESDQILDDYLVAGSVFLGVDSGLGPVYVAYGFAEGGDQAVYLYLGRTF
jgi:NTE family protein